MLFDEIVKEVCAGNRLEFRDFGVFEVVVRKPRTGRNPRTGQKVAVPPKTVVTFKMGKVMKEKVARAPGAAGTAAAPQPPAPAARASAGDLAATRRTSGRRDKHRFRPSVVIPRKREASLQYNRPRGLVEVAADRVADHTLQLDEGLGLRSDPLPQGVGDITTVHGILLDLKHDFAHAAFRHNSDSAFHLSASARRQGPDSALRMN